MIVRVIALILAFSFNAYAKPAHHSASVHESRAPSPTASEDDLAKQLTNHGWQITQMSKPAGLTFDADHWYFNFASNGKYKAFGSCNYVGGSYKVDGTGTFRINNLDGSNNHCGDGKDEEAAVFNILLMADSYEINGDTLLLKSTGQPLMTLKVSDKIVDLNLAHKSHGENKSKKLSQKKTGAHKAAQPNQGKAKEKTPKKHASKHKSKK